MSESKFETVSMLVDDYQLTDVHLDRLSKDPQLSDTWQHYHLIGDVMRSEVPETIHLDLSARIAQAIAEEPTILAPVARKSFTEQVKAKVVLFAKPVGQMAIAASAAGLMILGVQQTNVADNNVTMPNQVIHTMPLGGIADPVSYNVEQPDRAAQQQAYMMQQRRFQALLADHKQQIKLNNAVEEIEPAQAEVKDTPK
jgi:sigma-E factor negative regulatory protein RseA